MTIATQTSSPPRTTPQRAQVQSNCFCDCGYSLHGQLLTRDEQTGLLICRCPECGRLHPVGHGRGAWNLWLNRLGVLALVAWVLLLVGILGFGAFLLGLMQVGYVHAGFDWIYTTADGRQVEFRVDGTYIAGTEERFNPGAAGFRSQRVRGPAFGWGQKREAARFLLIFSSLIAGAMGLIYAPALWHVRRLHFLWLLLLPLVALPLVSSIWWVDDGPEVGRWAMKRAGTLAALQILVLGVAVKFGRPVARALVRLLVPPKPRQAMDFLWTADGKTPPQSEAC